MAYYAALVSLVELLKEITHPDHRPYPTSILDKQQIHVALYEKFNVLQDLLEGYLPKNKAAECLERRIRDVAYRAQDIVETHISDQVAAEDTKIPAGDKPRGVKTSPHLNSASKPAPRKLQHPRLGKKYHQDLEKVKAEVDSIVEELKRIKESNYTTLEHLELNSNISADSDGEASKVPTPSGMNTMVGFEEHLATIQEQLCGQSPRREVVSIVGMGGLGKSTLARNIYDHKLIRDRFDCCAWVTVSQDYHLQNILLAIVHSLDIRKKKLSEAKEGVLTEHIYKHLKGRRYLIVIDDIWETKVWDDIRRAFPNDNNGSRVIITTRMSNVAVYTSNSGFIHQLQVLDENQSWKLFCLKVFCPPNLETIGRVIAKNCGGLPLAIVVVAGLLSKVNKTRQDWKAIAREVSLVAIDQNDEYFSKILGLSYNHLPHHLKPCFLYLGGFPEDHAIPVSTLIRLWVAEGFLKPIASKSLEEVGEEYFKDLVNRNLVLVTKRKPDGKFKSCTIHDLLRDLCLQIACHENFLHCLHKKGDFHIRRLYCQSLEESLFHKYEKEHVSHVRSMLFSPKVQGERHFLSVASNFKLLRVFHTRSLWRSIFPNVIVERLHLRYLALDQAHNIRIPPSIFKLQNLQTFIVVHGKISLPSDIWKMPHLRHVMIEKVTLPPIPYGETEIVDGVPLLGSLQTLQRVKDFRFISDTIKMFPNLKKFEVECADLPYENWEEVGLSNLIHFRQLERLEICFFRGVRGSLPENFAFPSTLIKLTLEACELPWKDMSVVGSLPNLQVLKLIGNAFVGEEWEPVEGEFLKLKFLQLLFFDELKYWRADNTHFPCLEELQIRYCLKLEEIPSGIGDISTLRRIEVDAGSPSESSALQIKEEQQDLGNDDLQFRVFPRFHF